MIPRPAQYLLRFDDLCPTMSQRRWGPFRALIEDFHLEPILGVVPDNRDLDLLIDTPDPQFWNEMRSMQTSGSTIALHGYRHSCDSEESGLLHLHARTEFAGISEEIQRKWIHQGLAILREHSLHPRLFVAPRHGFDQTTLRVLKLEGIDAISDGFARVPFTRGGVTWIPQQLWEPLPKPAGLWTICIHPNSAGNQLVKSLRAFLETHASEFTCFDRVIAEFPSVPLPPAERLHEVLALTRIRISRLIRRIGRSH